MSFFSLWKNTFSFWASNVTLFFFVLNYDNLTIFLSGKIKANKILVLTMFLSNFKILTNKILSYFFFLNLQTYISLF